jgi:hypothetical protein
MTELTDEELFVLSSVLLAGWEKIYCYFNNKEPFNCIGKSIQLPANADFNGMIWICDDCRQSLLKKLRKKK